MARQLEGKRVNIWIPGKQLAIAKQIENLSQFFQLSLDQAPGIMAWAILHDKHPEKYPLNTKKLEDVVDEFNEKYPLDPLTQKRQGKWQQPSQPKQEIW